MATIQTPFQLIDIWDIFDGTENQFQSYERSLHPEVDTFESHNPQLFSLQRNYFLQGVLQSNDKDETAYHEALVHPAMFAHHDPFNVAIIGGGDGASLREILKHKSVEKVKMIEVDKIMVESSKKYLPSWSDCSDIIGSTPSCFNDERLQILYENAFAWFINNGKGGIEKKIEEENSSCVDKIIETEEKEIFDVIVMEALDPQEISESDTKSYYEDDTFVRSLFNSLSKDGILVMHIGSSPEHKDLVDNMGENKKRSQKMNMIEFVGFKRCHVYEEVR